MYERDFILFLRQTDYHEPTSRLASYNFPDGSNYFALSINFTPFRITEQKEAEAVK